MTTGTREVTFGPRDRALVYAVARKIVGSSADADDATQDALLIAFRYRDSFRGHARYHTWLHRIATTAALGQLRRTRRSPVHLIATQRERLQLEHELDPAAPPAEQLADAEDRAALRQALDALAPRYREVLLARVDASEREVAARLGISEANVKIRAHRARHQLRASLGAA